MPIMFNAVLRAAGFDLADVRLLRHQDGRAEKGRTPYELWRDDRPRFDVYQSTHSFRNQSKLAAPFWASFVGTPGGETLFVGVYQVSNVRIMDRDVPSPHREGVDLAGTGNAYDLTLDPRLSDLIGRLLIDWGPGGRAWIQRADNQDKLVTELRQEFKEPEFPGFLNLILQLSQVDAVPVAWATALRSSRGVYLLTCPGTKEQYVGAATGEGGFWARWQEYSRTGHGGNVALKSRDPSDYQISILEVAGSSATPGDVIDMEARWKSKLQSREMGLNRN